MKGLKDFLLSNKINRYLEIEDLSTEQKRGCKITTSLCINNI